MSIENVRKFYAEVLKDEVLKQNFVALSKKYQGQHMDEAKGMLIFEQEAMPLAAQMGYSFSMDDLKSYEVEMQQAKMGCELSDEEMQAVVGGASGMDCTLVGFSYGGTQGFCFIWGFSSGYQICTVSGFMHSG
jgi:bacteriocin-like protein